MHTNYIGLLLLLSGLIYIGCVWAVGAWGWLTLAETDLRLCTLFGYVDLRLGLWVGFPPFLDLDRSALYNLFQRVLCTKVGSLGFD